MLLRKQNTPFSTVYRDVKRRQFYSSFVNINNDKSINKKMYFLKGVFHGGSIGDNFNIIAYRFKHLLNGTTKYPRLKEIDFYHNSNII